MKERMSKYDNLVNKNVMLKKEMDTLKRNAKGKTCADKELIVFFFKKDNNKKRLEAEKEKNRLANLIIKEEK